MPRGSNNIPKGGLPSRPEHWRQARRVDIAYIKELESELALTRAHAKELEVERDGAVNAAKDARLVRVEERNQLRHERDEARASVLGLSKQIAASTSILTSRAEHLRAEVERLEAENRELRGYVVSAHRTIDRIKGNEPCTCRACDIAARDGLPLRVFVDELQRRGQSAFCKRCLKDHRVQDALAKRRGAVAAQRERGEGLS